MPSNQNPTKNPPKFQSIQYDFPQNTEPANLISLIPEQQQNQIKDFLKIEAVQNPAWTQLQSIPYKNQQNLQNNQGEINSLPQVRSIVQQDYQLVQENELPIQTGIPISQQQQQTEELHGVPQQQAVIIQYNPGADTKPALANI